MASISSAEGTIPGDASPELVPVVEAGALALALPQTAGVAAAGEIALDGLLSDALFGEVIDISDLIPRLLPTDDMVTPQVAPADAGALAFILPDGDGLAASHAAAALTIFYDDDILGSDSVIL